MDGVIELKKKGRGGGLYYSEYNLFTKIGVCEAKKGDLDAPLFKLRYILISHLLSMKACTRMNIVYKDLYSYQANC